MVKGVFRLGLVAGVALAAIAAACAPGCGSNTSQPVNGGPDASAGEAGEATAKAGSAGQGGTSASAGAKNGGSGGASAGEAGEAGAANAGAANAGGRAGSSGSAGEGGASGADSSAGAAGDPDTFTEVDAGSDCIPPTDTTRLSASALGLPTPGLTLWLRADKGIYMTSDRYVCGWEDQSGHDTVLTDQGAALRPQWEATSVGGKPALNFQADGHLLATGGVLGIPPTSARTFVAVMQMVDKTARFAPVMQGQSNTAGTYIMIDANTFDTAGQREGVYILNNSYDTALATSSSPRVHVYTINSMIAGTPIVGNTDYRVNGATQTLARNSGGLGNGNFEDFSGADFTLVGRGPGAYVAEALIYDRALSDAEKAEVEGVLEARYGITP